MPLGPDFYKKRKATLQQAGSNETSVSRLLIKSDARHSGDLSLESFDERKEGSIFVYSTEIL